jgi:hypothetical protein
MKGLALIVVVIYVSFAAVAEADAEDLVESIHDTEVAGGDGMTSAFRMIVGFCDAIGGDCIAEQVEASMREYLLAKEGLPVVQL